MSLESKLIRHQIFLERFAGDIARRMQIGIDRARDIVLSIISTQDLASINSTQLKEQLLPALNSGMENAFDEVLSFTEVEGQFIQRNLNKEFDETIEAATAEALANALVDKNMPVGLAGNENNRNIITAYEKFARDNAKLLTQPVRDAQVLGGDPLVAAASIAALAAGLLSVRAKTLSKASVTHAANTSRDTVYKANKNLIKEVEWVSVLDSHTTVYCRSQAGKRWPVGQGPRPPAHYNCRSITKPVVPSEESL